MVEDKEVHKNVRGSILVIHNPKHLEKFLIFFINLIS